MKICFVSLFVFNVTQKTPLQETVQTVENYYGAPQLFRDAKFSGETGTPLDVIKIKRLAALAFSGSNTKQFMTPYVFLKHFSKVIFLVLLGNASVCVSGVKKCSFFGKFCVRTKWMTP